MREIKAYIRCSKVDNVLSKLEAIGIQNITVIDVMAMGRGMVDKKHYKYSIDCIDRYSTVAKLEVVCSDGHADEIIDTIKSSAYTGQSGDGLILSSPVDFAMKIRSGKTGETVLQT